MPISSNYVKYLIGNEKNVLDMENLSPKTPFDNSIVQYLDRVSKQLLGNRVAKGYPDVVTFAFWCRKASIMGLRKVYDSTDRIGRGMVFHIAPSNVPVNFAYSLVAGLLAGDANIVRIPSKEFKQVDLICEALKTALDYELEKYVCLIRYKHNKDVTDALSLMCDTRIIWGGNLTIDTVRESPLKPRATEIAFSDRYSICAIDAEQYLKSKEKEKIAVGFFNDTYLTDQNACTSPKLIAWMGEDINIAQRTFWDELYKLIEKRYNLQPIQAINKYTNFCRQAIKNSVQLLNDRDNLITRVWTDKITQSIITDNGNSGYFIECQVEKLEELLPICGLGCQTLAYYGIGINTIRDFIMNKRPKGIDRAVIIGKTLDFDLVWDGFNLVKALSRKVAFVS